MLAVFAPVSLLTAAPVQKALLCAILLDVPLQIDKSFGHREEAAALSALGGFDVSVTTIALALLYLGWIASALSSRTTEPRRLEGNTPLLLYVGFAALSLTVARDVTLAAFELFLLAQMFLLYVYLVNWIRSRGYALFVASVLVAGLLLESALTLGLYLHPGARLPWVAAGAEASGDLLRAWGTFGSANTAGIYLSLFIPLAASFLFLRQRRARKTLALLALGLACIALLTTLSRGAWLACAVSMTVLVCAAWRGRRVSRRAAIVLVCVTIIAAVPFYALVTERIVGDDRGAALGRVPLMRLALEMIADNPLLGVGANNFVAAMDHYLGSRMGDEWFSVVHNNYLRIWAEAGVGGLVAFVWFLLSSIRQGWRAWHGDDPLLAPLALGMTAALVGYSVFMLIDLANRAQWQSLVCLAALIAVIDKLRPARHDGPLATR